MRQRANLDGVMSLRVWLLVLLAFAIPMRGAMAATMPCAPGPGHVHATAAAVHGHGHSAHAHPTSHAQDAQHPAASGHDSVEKCSFCASCCAVPAPASVSVAMPQAPPARAQFPAYLAPAAEFFSGGQERPPRSI